MNNNRQSENMSKATVACLTQLRDLVEQRIVRSLQWYETHTNNPRIFFRLSGTLLILLSICLPVLSSISSSAWPYSWPSKELLVSFIALVIALLSALSTFYHWSETWRVNMSAKMELKNLLAIWEVCMVEAQQLTTQKDITDAAIKATKDLFDAAAKVDTSNTEHFFKNVKFPET
jgi:ABC-type multidrug transport system fused ATPase/permease subunit